MDTIVNWLTDAVGPTVVFYGLFGFALKEIVEYTKAASRGVSGKIKVSWLHIGGYGSLALAAILGIGAAYQYDLNVFQLFETLKETDPELATLITSAVGIGIARYWKAKEKATKK